MPYLIAPSILSANFAHLGKEVSQVLKAGADWIHVDVMDNHYVPNLTFGPLIVEALRRDGVNAPIDVHLMVEPVDDLIVRFASAGASMISFHPEASRHVDRSIELIKSSGCQAALALNPSTPLAYLDHTLDKLDMVLIMSVNPGFGGQSFIPSMLKKIQAVQERIRLTGRHIHLQVDGGVKLDNIAQIAQAGANVFVAGSAIFGQPSYPDVIRAFREKLS